MTRTRGRAPVGERSYGTAPKSRGRSVTLCGAICLGGMRAMMAYEGGTTNELFLHFVERVLVQSLHRGYVVIMDNLAAHRQREVGRALRVAGASCVYLPPYSPELNPIEMTWSKVKHLLRRAEARTLDRLVCEFGRIRNEITPSDCLGWYRHAGYVAQCA